MVFRKKIFLILFFGSFLNIIINFLYINNLNHYEKINSNKEINHYLIKGMNENHWRNAYKLKKNLASGKNFFESSPVYYRNFLQPYINYIYSKITNDPLYELDQNNNLIISKNNKKILLLIFQSLLYFFSIYFLMIKMKFCLPEGLLTIIACTLIFEPTLNQWHSFFGTESIFLSIQIFLLALLVSEKKSFYHFILIGIFTGLLFAQRSAALFYFIFIICFFLILLKNNRLKGISLFLVFYLVSISFIGLNSYIRTGIFYLTPLDQRAALYNYFEPHIISKRDNISFFDAKNKIKLKHKKWLNENNLDIDPNQLAVGEEKDLLIYHNFIKQNSLKTILSEPVLSFERIIKKSLHSGLLDPVYVFFYNTYEYEGSKPYYKSELHNKILNYRLFYSIFIYLFSLLGFFYFIRTKSKKLSFILLCSYFYFLAILGWMGTTRYYAASLPYLFIFFSAGIYELKNKFLKRKDNLNL